MGNIERDLAFVTSTRQGKALKESSISKSRVTLGAMGRKVDLLEVYCEPNSQWVQQVNAKGGHAIRFTRLDGIYPQKKGFNGCGHGL